LPLSAPMSRSRREAEPFVKDAAALMIWSKEFFLDGVRIHFHRSAVLQIVARDRPQETRR